LTTNDSPVINLSDYYEPHSAQQLVHDSTANVKTLKAARRFGKSRLSLWELIYTYVKSLDIPAPLSVTPPFHAWVVVPSMPQGRQTWNELLTFIPKEFVHSIQVEEKVIYLRGSEQRPWGLIELKSAFDVDSLQTVGLDFLWVVEAQDIPDSAFEKLLPTLRSPGRMSQAIFEGIPSLWRDHWFQRIYEVAERGRPGYAAFTFTVYDNPMLSPGELAEVEDDRELLREAAWRRMYLAEFSESAGYFQKIDDAIWGDFLEMPLPGRRYVAGLDLGRKKDPSVLFIGDAQERRIVHMLEYDTGQSWIIQKAGVVDACRQWEVERVLVDSTGMGGDMFFQELQEQGVPAEEYIFNASSREHLLNSIGISLERSAVSFPKIPALARQLRAMQYRKMASGRFRVEVPPGEHDDHPFALGLMLEVCDPVSTSEGTASTSGRRMRYSPSQEEASGSEVMNGVGVRLMRERLQKRMEERWEKSGVKV
jgi:hypothetical protein